jgi:hypothetical protein
VSKEWRRRCWSFFSFVLNNCRQTDLSKLPFIFYNKMT